MSDPESKNLFDKGIRQLTEGNTLSALSYFERASQLKETPLIFSCLAFCIAKERGQVKKAIAMCQDAISTEPENSSHYLNLGKIYLIEKKKEEAVNVFRKGLHYEENEQIVDELNKLGTRRPPVLPFLERSNFLNKCLGILLSRLGIRS